MKKIIVTYTMKKPEAVKEIAETCIVLSVCDTVARLWISAWNPAVKCWNGHWSQSQICKDMYWTSLR